MKPVEIYTTPLCGFCHAAKRLLNKRGVQFTEYNVSFDRAKRKEMLKRAHGNHTVPQIFVGTTHVGGFEELVDLDQSGKLKALLAA